MTQGHAEGGYREAMRRSAEVRAARQEDWVAAQDYMRAGLPIRPLIGWNERTRPGTRTCRMSAPSQYLIRCEATRDSAPCCSGSICRSKRRSRPRREELREHLVHCHPASGHAVAPGTLAKDVQRVTVRFEAVCVVARAHLALGLLDLVDQPRRSIGIEPLAGVVDLVRSLEGVDQAPADRRLPFPHDRGGSSTACCGG